MSIVYKIIRPINFHRLVFCGILAIAALWVAALILPTTLYYGINAKAGSVAANVQHFEHQVHSVVMDSKRINCKAGGTISTDAASIQIRQSNLSQGVRLECKNCVAVLINSEQNGGIVFSCNKIVTKSRDAEFKIEAGDAISLSGTVKIGSTQNSENMILTEGEVYSESRVPIFKEYQKPTRSEYKLSPGDYVYLLSSEGRPAESESHVKSTEDSLVVTLKAAANAVGVFRFGTSEMLEIRLQPDILDVIKSNPIISLIGLVISAAAALTGPVQRKESE